MEERGKKSTNWWHILQFQHVSFQHVSTCFDIFQQCFNSNKSRLLYFNWPRESSVDCSPHSRHCQAKQLPTCPALWQGQLNINFNQGVADAYRGCKDFWRGARNSAYIGRKGEAKHEAKSSRLKLRCNTSLLNRLYTNAYVLILIMFAHQYIPIRPNVLPVDCNNYHSATDGYGKCIALLLSLNLTESNIDRLSASTYLYIYYIYIYLREMECQKKQNRVQFLRCPVICIAPASLMMIWYKWQLSSCKSWSVKTYPISSHVHPQECWCGLNFNLFCWFWW